MERRYRIRYKNICDIPDVEFPVESAYVVVFWDDDAPATAEGLMLAAIAKFRTLMLETPNDCDHEIISIQSIPTITITPDVSKSPNVRLISTMYHSDYGTGDSMMETIKYAIEDGLDLSDAEIQYLLESVGDDDFVGPEDIREYLADHNHVEIVVEDGAVSDVLTTDMNMDTTIIYVDHDDDDDARLAVDSHVNLLTIVKGYHRVVGAITMTPKDLLTKDSEIPQVKYNKDLNTIDMTPSAAIAINRLVIDAANVVSGKPEDVHMLLDIIHTLTSNTKWLPDEPSDMQVRMDVDTVDALVQKVGGILIDTADDNQRFITMLANTLADAYRHKSSACENTEVSIKPGDVVKLGGLEWVVQHIDGDRVYLALRTITDVCAGDYIDSMLKIFTKKMRPLINCNFRAFVPSREQLETEWDWPKADASNRICQFNGSDKSYWTSTVNSPGINSVSWYVNINGDLYNTFFPSYTIGFRPAIEIGIDDLTSESNPIGDSTDGSPFNLGDVVIYGDQRWTIQHIADDDVYMATTDIIDQCTLHRINDKLNDWKINLERAVGHDVDVFIPSKDMYESDWNWPSASAKNRICKNLSGCNSAYWTRTTESSGCGWFVDYDGTLRYNIPSCMFYFRPAIGVTMDELIKKGVLDGNKEG